MHKGNNPILPKNRIEFLDALRGVALLGIILANMVSYSLFLYLADHQLNNIGLSRLDKILDFLELMLIEGKFYTIFSILFGIGFSIIIERSRSKNQNFIRFFLWRMTLLALMGVIHAIFFWHNDILLFYACCGMLLIPMSGLSGRTILFIAIIMFLVPLGIKLTFGTTGDLFLQIQNQLFEKYGFTESNRVDVWTNGSWIDILQLNLSMWFGQFEYVIGHGMIYKIFGSFLIGYLFGRRKLHERLVELKPDLKKIALWGVLIGLVLNFIYASNFYTESWKLSLSETFGILPLSLGYIALTAIFWQSDQFKKGMSLFVPVGRMALTNYIFQSVICTLIFYNTGLALGAEYGPSRYLLLGLIIYACQVIMSKVWLAKFQYGPLEWLWRSLTYGKILSNLKNKNH
ncbi:uncharacterized protein ATE92_0117 [Ulvibacter sp. MAR_2010_11]|uniref:DUF418 domain-containing protein n=1 Tax=Ulvibacter sp. MAR_2010_11 TaxID=1250229 RepID=UPI000C2CDC0C|nr:DUF418 domain-containing protein [Ulvibacter sp. MAR_2010_11]PKA81994.1 uncharacterized protein ATE92_0117 [Ulvibacter sp. MAR_2010_11]